MSPRLRMYWAVSVVHAGCWLPLYCDTLVTWGRGSQEMSGSSLSHEVINDFLDQFFSLTFCQCLAIQTLICTRGSPIDSIVFS